MTLEGEVGHEMVLPLILSRGGAMEWSYYGYGFYTLRRGKQQRPSQLQLMAVVQTIPLPTRGGRTCVASGLDSTHFMFMRNGL